MRAGGNVYPVVFLLAYGLPVCARMAGHGGVPFCCAQGTQLEQAEQTWQLSGLKVIWADLQKVLYLGTWPLFIPFSEILSIQNKGLSLSETKTVLLALSSISGLIFVRWGHTLSVLDEGKKYLLPWVL